MPSHPKPYIFMIRVNRQIKCPKSWGIVFILHRKIFPIHHTYIYSLVSYLFIKQDQMILTCNSADGSLMLSRSFYTTTVRYYKLNIIELCINPYDRNNRWNQVFWAIDQSIGYKTKYICVHTNSFILSSFKCFVKRWS